MPRGVRKEAQPIEVRPGLSRVVVRGKVAVPAAVAVLLEHRRTPRVGPVRLGP